MGNDYYVIFIINLLLPEVMFSQVCVITARKRSLGQGNNFTPVCHSVHGRGWVSQHALQVT